jgi:hypothetical protein
MNTLYLEVDTISEALQELLEAGTPEENLQVLEKYPELLTEETNLQLNELIDQVKELVAEDIINALVARQTWLQELREAIVIPKMSPSKNPAQGNLGGGDSSVGTGVKTS